MWVMTIGEFFFVRIECLVNYYLLLIDFFNFRELIFHSFCGHCNFLSCLVRVSFHCFSIFDEVCPRIMLKTIVSTNESEAFIFYQSTAPE